MSDQSIRIVFIEDYQLIRMGISTYLDSVPDFQVVAQVGTAEEGLDEVARHNPDIVLMDVGLPRMNGIEATRIIKQRSPETKVLMLTSHESEESVIAALGAGANAYCLKGIPTERLVEVIRSVVDGAAWLDPTIANIALSIFTEAPSAMKASSPSEVISLGEREREVLRLLTLGKNNQEIADELYVSVHTVKSQVSTILQKLSVHDRVQAAVKAITTGILKLEEVQLP